LIWREGWEHHPSDCASYITNMDPTTSYPVRPRVDLAERFSRRTGLS
jgi:hypothetical protein